MSASYLRLTKSETREIADREYRATSLDEPVQWRMSNGTFFTAFVVVVAILAVIALVVR